MLKRNPNVRYVQRQSNLRSYMYIARVCKLTGRLLGISAGCRRWKTFRDARQHYGIQYWKNGDLHGAAHHNWADDRGKRFLADRETALYSQWWANRQEARKLLEKLQRDVQTIQARIRRRNKRA